MTAFGDELWDLIDMMFLSVYVSDGVGLAANQVGVDARLFVVDCPDESGQHTIAHVVNPTVEDDGDRELIVGSEGCLSVPGAWGDVARLRDVWVRGVDLRGTPST